MKLLRKSLRSRLYENKKLYIPLIVLGVVIIAAASYGITRSNTGKHAVSQPNTTSESKKLPTTVTAPVPAKDPDPVLPPTNTQPQPLPKTQVNSKYPLHENIVATVFWVGEGADNSNDFIHNSSSAWATNWVGLYGGIDDPTSRCGYRPCAFTPKENPFYFALPFNDYGEDGRKPLAVLKKIPWYTSSVPDDVSILKNRWIEVRHGQKTAYAQWEDVGPFGEDDVDYVFGYNRPAESRAGLDMSPALADYLGVSGRGTVSWRFIDAADVPNGEWTKAITTSNLQY